LNDKDGSSPSTVRRGSYRSGFAFGVVSFLANGVVGAVTTLLISRIYGVKVVGEFALISAPVLMLGLVSTVKEQAALVKEITGLAPRHPRVTELFSAVFTFSFGLTVLLAIPTMIITSILFRGPLHHPALVAPALVNIAGYTLINNNSSNFDTIFSTFVAGRQLFVVRLYEVLSVMVITTGLGLAWHSIWGLVFGTLGGSLIALAHRIIVVRPYVRLRLTRSEARAGLRALPGLLRFGIRITPGGIAQGLSTQVGIWTLAGFRYPLSTIGAYSRAQSIPERMQGVNQVTSQVLYPTLVGRRHAGDGEGFDRALIDSIRYALIGTLLVAAVFGGAAHSLLAIFGPGFSRGAPALALLILAPVLAAIWYAQDMALLAAGRPGLTSIMALARLGLTIVLTVALTPTLGITGPAIALLAGALLQVCWGWIATRELLSEPLRVTWPLRERFAPIAAYACGFGAALAVEHAMPTTAGLLLSLTAGTLVYLAAIILGGGVNGRDRRRLAESAERLKAWRKRRSPPKTPIGLPGG